jgi:ribosomal protein S18 acetylase RimI-like enzyme
MHSEVTRLTDLYVCSQLQRGHITQDLPIPPTMSDSEYVILEGRPAPQNYHDIRKLAGMTPPPLEAVPKSLANSLFMVVAYERKHMLDDATPGPEQEVVAMGRLVGDGSLFLIMVDVCVHPDHQRQGLGKRIVQGLCDYIDEHAPLAYVSMVADKPAQQLYPRYGFKSVEPSIGMYRMNRP